MNQISPPGAMRHYHQVDRHSADAILDALSSAWQEVQSGDLLSARRIVAEMVMRFQPRLAIEHALLTETVAVLAAAHGVRAIARLLAATSGQPVQVSLAPVPGRTDRCEVLAVGRDGSRLRCKADVADAHALRRWSETVLDHCLRSGGHLDFQDLVLAPGN